MKIYLNLGFCYRIECEKFEFVLLCNLSYEDVGDCCFKVINFVLGNLSYIFLNIELFYILKLFYVKRMGM